MTELEIMQERDRLISEMDPSLIEFLRTRRKNLTPKIFTESLRQGNIVSESGIK